MASETVGEDDLSRVAVEELVGRLPPHEQALFVMNVFEGYAARDLAELFGLRPDAVRQRLCSARARLRRWYAETEGWRERT